MRILLTIAVLATGLGACGYVSKYESQVHDWEPVYCYRTLAAVECRAQPDRTRDALLVNYYGPDPSRTDPPEKRDAAPSNPPPAVNYWVKDPEPIPRPAPTGDLSDRPWLLDGETAPEAASIRAKEPPTGTL